MRFYNYILRVLRRMRPRVLIRVAKISSSLFFSTTPDPLCINLGVFFLFDTPFSLARTGFLIPDRLNQTPEKYLVKFGEDLEKRKK